MSLLVAALRDAATVLALDGDGWTALIATARAEQIVGSLAHRVADLPIPAAAARLMADARASADQGRTAALWEAEMARRALSDLDVPVVLLKGTAYVAAGLAAGVGRSIGDLDILVPRDRLDEVESALLAAGWEWVKPDPYDDAYYRRWMHELPPLIHRTRDRMIDVHHTILPLTARITPDASALIADSIALENGLRVLAPSDMILHAVAHLFADGDLAGGLRNLWDIHRLLDEFGEDGLAERAKAHGLQRELARALRLRDQLFLRAPAKVGVQGHERNARNPGLPPSQEHNSTDSLYIRRILARDDWGRATRPFIRFAFYLRSHWLRMPPLMLARHLWSKWRRG